MVMIVIYEGKVRRAVGSRPQVVSTPWVARCPSSARFLPRPYHPCRTCTSKAPDTGVSAQLVEQFDEGQGVGVVEQARADFGHVLSPELFCFLALVSRDEANEAPMRPVGAAPLLLLILPAH